MTKKISVLSSMFSINLYLRGNKVRALLNAMVLSFLLISSSVVAEVLEKPTECLVCGRTHDNADHKVKYKGMEIPLCSDKCFDHYSGANSLGKLDPITAKIEPRAALFQEDSNPRDPMTKMFFWLGYYILIGLVFGGAASYLAIQKGYNAWSAFLLGLLLNVLGYFIVWVKPRQKRQFSSEGLTKVPKTRNEIICSECGHSNHPSAKKCNECGRKMKSAVRSEVQAAGLRKRN